MTQSLQFKRTVNVPPAEAYRAFVHATALRDWLCDAAQTEARVGGRLYLSWNDGYVVVGQFVKLEPGKKLVFTWRGQDEPAPTRVQVSFAAKGDGARITLKHDQIGSGSKWAKTVLGFQTGWTESLENLQSVLETGIDLRQARAPRMGIFIGEFNAEVAAQLGVPAKAGIRLEGTGEGTGARAAGLQKDDVLVRLGGKKAVDFPSLHKALQGHHAGDKVRLVFYRAGEKKTATLELGARPMPDVPAAARELAGLVRKNFADANTALAQMLDGVTEVEAEHHPAPDAWNVKQTIAHLILCERDVQSWAADMLNDTPVNDWLEMRPNVNERILALIERYDMLPALVTALKHAQVETVNLLAALPDSFVARKHLYRRVAAWMMDTVPFHYHGEHLGAIKAALEAARLK
jgi:uncharacterized protein YndB with AHSA1/START domain